MTEATEQEQKLGKYTLLRKLAQGGMAEIFLATQHGAGGFQKQLVIKRILPHLADDKKFVEMFLDEARIAAQFNDPNIVQIYDLGEADGQYFIAMEYIDGFDLSQIIERAAQFGKRVPPPIAAKIIRDSLNGLHYAHTFRDPQTGQELKLVHRDISPQNLLVNKGGVTKLVDFGVAKAKTSSSKTQTGAVKGKFSYMAPEQIAGETLDGRCDIFAMGIVFYELLLGVRPFGEHSDLMAITAIVHQPPKSPRQIDEQFPAELEDILMRALAKNRDERYPSALAMQEAIEGYIASTGQVVSTRAVARYLENLFSENPNLNDIGFGASETHSLKMADLHAQSGESPAVDVGVDTSRSQQALQPQQPQQPRNPQQSMPQPAAPSGPIGPNTAAFPDAKQGGTKGLLVAVVVIAVLVLGGGGVLAFMLFSDSDGGGETSADKEDDEQPDVVSDEPDVIEDTGGVGVAAGNDNDVQESSPDADVEEETTDVAVANSDATIKNDVDDAVEGEPDVLIVAQQDVSHIKPEDLPGAAASVTAGFGEVRIKSNLKGARILYRGQRVGKTPQLLSFPAGQVELTLIDKEHHARKAFSITVFEKRRYEVELEVEKGKLILKTEPEKGFQVKIDGKKQGKTPIDPVELYEGTHSVELSKDGKRKKYSLTVMPGDNERTIRVR